MKRKRFISEMHEEENQDEIKDKEDNSNAERKDEVRRSHPQKGATR